MAKQFLKWNSGPLAVLDPQKMQQSANIFYALNHKLRQEILGVITEKGETNVNVIYNTLKIEQSITSQHLKVLRGADIVRTRRDGKKIYYSINTDLINLLEKSVQVLTTPVKKKKKFFPVKQ